MPKYTTDYLYNEFSQLAGMRAGSQYSNDAGYWTGGRCNWGGSHNLREDCGTLARGFEKLESLDGKDIIAELNKCTSQGEYESKKADYIRKANEISSGLQARTGYSSSMFGVCIIWADQAMSPYVENKMQDCRRKLENLKSQLTGEKYQHIEELRILKLEEKKIRDKISQLKREASKEKDPTKRAKILLLVEEQGKLLENNLRKQKAIPTSKINFEPGKYVSDFVEGIRRALQGRNGGSGGDSGEPRKPRNPRSPDNPFGDDKEDDYSNEDDKKNKTKRKKKGDETQSNQQLIIFAIVALVIIFLLMNQKDSPSRHRYNEYDYYD